MKQSTEFDAFDTLVGKVLSVSHEEIKKREQKYREAVARNPKRRGPKRKVKAPAS